METQGHNRTGGRGPLKSRPPLSTAHSPYMDFETSGSVCAPDRLLLLLLLSVLSASPLDMCLFSGSCGETGKAGVGGGWVASWREAAPSSSGVAWPRRPSKGLGGTPPAAAATFRPTSGLEGMGSLLPPAGGGWRVSEGLAWPRRRWRAGLGGVLVATVRCSVLGLPGTVCTPMTLTCEPSGEAGRWAGPGEGRLDGNETKTEKMSGRIVFLFLFIHLFIRFPTQLLTRQHRGRDCWTTEGCGNVALSSPRNSDRLLNEHTEKNANTN